MRWGVPAVHCRATYTGKPNKYPHSNSYQWCNYSDPLTQNLLRTHTHSGRTFQHLSDWGFKLVIVMYGKRAKPPTTVKPAYNHNNYIYGRVLISVSVVRDNCKICLFKFPDAWCLQISGKISHTFMQRQCQSTSWTVSRFFSCKIICQRLKTRRINNKNMKRDLMTVIYCLNNWLINLTVIV